VEVDGLLNGWIMPSQVTTFRADYTPAPTFMAAKWFSLAAALFTLLLALRIWMIKVGLQRIPRMIVSKIRPASSAISNSNHKISR
jgi:hypothetical protein